MGSVPTLNISFSTGQAGKGAFFVTEQISIS
jgi:hypothetical protein